MPDARLREPAVSTKQRPNGKPAKRTIDSRAPRGEYMVAFDTSAAAATGTLIGVKITIEPCTLSMEETARIDLSCHPLYEHLRSYCASNAPQRPAEGSR